MKKNPIKKREINVERRCLKEGHDQNRSVYFAIAPVIFQLDGERGEPMVEMTQELYAE